MRSASTVSLVGALLLVPLAAGCAPSETRVVRVIHTSELPAHPWIGKPEAAVREEWGRSPGREPDGKGGSILTYRRKEGIFTVESTREAGSLDRPSPTLSGRDAPPSPLGTEKRTAEPGIAARFWVDPDGIVYRVWFASSVYESGEDSPGSRRKPEP